MLAEEKAEEPTSIEPAKALQIWAAILTIENMEFTRDLANPSSQTFRKLSGTLTVLLSNVLNQVSGFLSVHVKSFQRGSVVCMFDIHANLESSATAEDFEKALIDAANNRKIGNYHITNIQVKDNVKAVMKEKTPQGQRYFLLRVIAVIIFAVGVAVLIVLFIVKAIRKKRRQRSEGFVDTGEVYPLSEFNTTNTEMGERKPTLRKKVLMSSDGELDEDANELTPFYKPGYAQA
ncbi:unnamed protein product [Porites evermanni]|uniref:SEA domain-containing protein n=1 Tax=Porites evermanni TaxID=104178 RepID=A0ABN8LD03_9CNID|nr:unnamed protein product [Porites evermanni]